MSSPNNFNQQVIEEYRANGGKVTGMFAGSDLLLLTTTGAKSGKTYTSPLGYGKDGDRIFIVASKAGAPTNPDWYHNLIAHPEVTVEIGTDSFQAKAVPTEGEERKRLFDKMVEKAPGFGEYQKKTTREIPIIVLERLN
jgi:deazaflavin-dependent oxidoreductase (nitroreductase family)